MTGAASHDNPLEERYSHDILIRLLESGTMMKTELLRSVSKSSCMIGRLERLEEAGLVETYNDTFSYNTKWVSLTAKGSAVARLIKQIHDIMDGNMTVNGGRVDNDLQNWGDEMEGAFAQSVEPTGRRDDARNPPD